MLILIVVDFVKNIKRGQKEFEKCRTHTGAWIETCSFSVFCTQTRGGGTQVSSAFLYCYRGGNQKTGTTGSDSHLLLFDNFDTGRQMVAVDRDLVIIKITSRFVFLLFFDLHSIKQASRRSVAESGLVFENHEFAR